MIEIQSAVSATLAKSCSRESKGAAGGIENRESKLITSRREYLTGNFALSTHKSKTLRQGKRVGDKDAKVINKIVLKIKNQLLYLSECGRGNPSKVQRS